MDGTNAGTLDNQRTVDLINTPVRTASVEHASVHDVIHVVPGTRGGGPDTRPRGVRVVGSTGHSYHIPDWNG